MSLCTDVQNSGVNEGADNASFSSTSFFSDVKFNFGHRGF